MTFTNIRKFLGAVIQSFGFVSLFISDWILDDGRSPATIPDPARGLIYACHPKGVDWYYSAFTVVKSWNFVAFLLIILLGAVLVWADESAPRGMEGFVKSYGKGGVVGIVIGAAVSLWFVVQYETVVVEWLVAKGFGPPALPCFPLFSGVS